jgi:hypothetical protein
MAMSSPGVTSADTFESQHTTFQDAMLHHRLFHVLATSGCVPTARRKQGRNHILVDQNGKYGYLSQVGFKHLLYLLVRYSQEKPKLLN